MTTLNKHDIEFYKDKMETFLLEYTYRGKEEAADMKRLLFKHFLDPIWGAGRCTTHFMLTHAMPINLLDINRALTEFMKKQVIREFQITTCTLREDPTPRLVIGWSTELGAAALSRKRKTQAEPVFSASSSSSSASASHPETPVAKKQHRDENTCVDCKIEASAEQAVPLPEVKGLFRHAIDDKGEWILPRTNYVALQELKLPTDTHEDLCTTLRRLYILTGLLTPLDLQVEVSVIKPHLVLEILNFSTIDLEQWASVSQFIEKQKVYPDILFQYESQRRSVLRLILRHANPIFAD